MAIMPFVVAEEMLRDAHGESNFDSLVIRLAFFGGFLFTLFLDRSPISVQGLHSWAPNSALYFLIC